MIPPRPMLASTGGAPLDSHDFAYEPKYDGVRAIAVVEHGTARLWSRLGNEKTAQFPEVVDALARWNTHHGGRRLILDGEIVALDAHGDPAGFQNLQGRIHLKKAGGGRQESAGTLSRVAYILFDILQDGDEDLRNRPLRDRRRRLEQVLEHEQGSCLRISEHVPGNGRALHARAEARGWEGLIAKRLESTYQPGKRTPDWRKLKLVRHQTCIVGGWTEPRGSRPFFGALLLGLHDDEGRLEYVGHSGAGFTDAELGRVWKQLHALQIKTCPFATVPKTNERPHWVRPKLVVEVKFTEWTADGKLRHPTYLGVRDDVAPADVKKEPDAVASRGNADDSAGARATARKRSWAHAEQRAAMASERATPKRRAPQASSRRNDASGKPAAVPTAAQVRELIGQLDEIQARGGNGVLALPSGERLEVTNLGKVFWPAQSKKAAALTKGDLFRHYVRVAPAILPVLADRPLVMKRFPNGITGKPFYQHRQEGRTPAGVRVADVTTETEVRPHIIGGSLMSLLYTVQLASISQDPWFSRVGSEAFADHVAIDLDPPDGLPFARVLDVARWVRDELDAIGASGFPKTSGSGGLHIYVPLPPDTGYDAGLLYCQIIATLVARRHPRAATVERSVAARGQRVYVDYLQNIKGKTLASAYSARANTFAGVSTPLTWDEVEEGVTPQDFTVRNFPARLAQAGDLWAAVRKARGADLRVAARYAGAALDHLTDPPSRSPRRPRR
jgi:bifunctional non-homologous end joining protein LigD